MGKWKMMRARLAASLELPEDAMGNAHRLQLVGNTAMLCGCKKLLKYKSEEIAALTADAVITFSGAHLKCVYFYEGTIEICGEIRNIGIEKR